jgi:copper homeostasis protein (lipoprotein)
VGTVPCADCAGIRYHLNLFADDSFALRRTYVGRPGGPVDDWGSWTVSSDRRVLVLQGRDDRPVYFAIPTSGSLRQLDLEGLPIAGRAPNELRRTSAFRPADLVGAFRGVYTYLADAASFVECSTGQRWPIAGEQASRDLERLYTSERPAPGAAVMAEVQGRVTLRPRVDGPGTESTLIVEKVDRLLPRESCAPRFAGSPLTRTHWLLTRLAGKAIPPAADARRELSLTFQLPEGDAPGAFSASTGCNRLIGTYVTDNATMTLTPGGTLMACKDDAAIEAAIVAALKATRHYRVAGRTLELLDAKGERLARFVR